MLRRVPHPFVTKAGFPSEQKGGEIITRRSARVTFHKVNESDNTNQTFRYKLILSPTLSRKLKNQQPPFAKKMAA
jgi:hypothetical protein